MSDRFVTIRKLSDPVEAQMFVELLETEGIVASTPGLEHGRMFGGIGVAALAVPLQVRETDVERAKAILAALEDYDEVDPADRPLPEMADADGPYRGGAAHDDEVPMRNPVVAIAAAVVLPMILGAFGAGHFYVRRYGAGFGLLALAWAAIVVAVAKGWGEALVVLPIVMLIDAGLAFRAAQQTRPTR